MIAFQSNEEVLDELVESAERLAAGFNKTGFEEHSLLGDHETARTLVLSRMSAPAAPAMGGRAPVEPATLGAARVARMTLEALRDVMPRTAEARALRDRIDAAVAEARSLLDFAQARGRGDIVARS